MELKHNRAGISVSIVGQGGSLSSLLLSSTLISNLHLGPAPLDSVLQCFGPGGDSSLYDPHITSLAHFDCLAQQHTHSHSPSLACVDTCIAHTVAHISSELGPGGFGCDCRPGLWRDHYGACRAHLWLLLGDGRQLAVCVCACVCVCV